MVNTQKPAQPWWQGAVIYQIYPRSFADSNGDGIGDLRGVINKLDYIHSLGVDAIWLSPFFTSPMDDFGYDISNYRDVDPMFGTLADFDELVSKAHALGLKIMIDQVLSHTSDQHPWFEESRQDRTNPKADWYVWADPKADGGPPNNWLAIFGGYAWQWEARRQQYYLHNFLTSQPDLNYHNSEVQTQILEEVKFWLDRGVDGLRLDAINFCYHDEKLRDNPAKPISARAGRGFSSDNPYAYQYHYYNNTRPENFKFLKKLRALCNQYPDIATLGEVSSEDSVQTMLDYTNGDEHLHMAYSFELLVEHFCRDHIRTTVEQFISRSEGGWPCWAISNHDVARVASRWGGEEPPPQLSKMLTAMVCSLQGSVCIYQGEELGLTEADVEFEDLQDPFGIAFWPRFKGRDGCRTPMPWQAASEHAGFSLFKPWLPISQSHISHSVDQQMENPDSVLAHFHTFMAFRKQCPELLQGAIEFIDAPDHVLAFYRIFGDSKLLCAFNLSKRVVELALPCGNVREGEMLSYEGCDFSTIKDDAIELPPLGVAYLRVRSAS